MYPNQSPYPPNQGYYPPPPGAAQPTPLGFAPPPVGYPPLPGQNPPYPASPFAPQQHSSGAYPPAGGFGYPAATSPYPPTQGYPGGPQQASSPYPSSGPGGYPPPLSAYPPSSPYPGGPPSAYPGAASASQYQVQQGGGHHHNVHHQQVQQHQHSALHHTPASATMASQVPDIPTIRDGPFDAAADAQALRKAMKGFGTDEKGLINVLCKRTNNQRLQIANQFKSLFGKDLVKDLKSETSGNFEELLVALVTPRYEYIADRVKSAVSGIGTKEHALIDILCTSSNQELQWIQHAFHAKYHQRLEDEVGSDTSGHFKRLLVSMCSAGRNEMPHTDPNLAIQDAQALYNAGLKQWGTDESVFNMVMCNRSYPHLRQVFVEYEKITGQDIGKTIKSEFSGDIEDALLAIVKCVKNRPAYFAERIHHAMRGMGTNDSALIFYMVTRADIDLETIKQEYNKIYSRSLSQDISSDASGDYKNGLLALL